MAPENSTIYRIACAGCVVVALCLALAVAQTSPVGVHPDELDHCNAASWYKDHWLPPEVCETDALYTYSNYGFSYLHHLDIVYFFAGKAALALDRIESISCRGLRLFNVALFLALIPLMLRRDLWLAALPLLITPQVWYLFSYFNGDAFAFFLSMIAAFMLLDRKSLINGYLDETRPLAAVAPLGVVLGLMLLSKINYYVFGLFVVAWLAVLLVRTPQRRKGLVLVAAIALAIYGARVGVEYMVNEPNKDQKIMECAERLADDGYKPSQIATSEGLRSAKLRDKGVSFSEILFNSFWPERSFKSFTGLYARMVLPSPDWYYLAMGIGYGGLLIMLAWFAVRHGGRTEKAFLAALLAGSALTLFFSAYHSWTSDFQPQGRYLFPILPMLSCVLHKVSEARRPTPVVILCAALFVLSVYSFITAALLPMAEVGQ